MRYDLDREFFISVQVFILPIISFLVPFDVYMLIIKEYISLIIIVVLTIIFIVLEIYFYKFSRGKKHYILIEENEVIIVYFDDDFGQKKDIVLTLKYEQIKKFDYVCIATFWLSFYCAYPVGRSLHITYDDGNELKEPILIGYIKYKDIRNICKSLNIPLKVHHLI